MSHHRARAFQLALLITITSVGCAGAPPKQVGDDNNFDQTPTGPVADDSAADSSDSPPSDEATEADALNTEQRAQMEVALRRGGDKAAQCSSVVADAPSGEGEVKVLFDGGKSRITDVTVGAPFAGTPAEACIKRSFIGEIVLPFEGKLEVPYTVKLPPKKAEGATDDKSKGTKK